MHSATHDAIAAVWRIESARIVAHLARMVRDLGVAEELAQDALIAALEHWPRDGIPANPAAWLMTAGKRRAIDHLRRVKTDAQSVDALAGDMVARGDDRVPDIADGIAEAWDDPVGDDVLRLVFTACHPVLPAEARVALTLKVVAGLTTHEIARAYLVPEPTIAQRLVRAKRKLAEARVPFELPAADALASRLASVLQVVYLVFNEGYTATSGEDWTRPALCDEALRLARMLAALAPREPEVLGLQALIELQASRLAARTDAQGAPVLLPDQDRRTWDRLLIRRGLEAIDRAQSIGEAQGPYLLQARIAACHARAVRYEDTDWRRIAALYAQLAQVMPSPVVELNRAVAVAMADGPAAGLALLDALDDHPQLQDYQWLPGTRGDLLARLGRNEEARAAFTRAAALARNVRERDLLLARAEAMRE